MKIIPKYKIGNPIIYTDANTGERFTDMPSGYHVVNGSPQTVNIPEVTVYGHKPGSGNFTSNNKLLEILDLHDIDTKNIDKLIEEGYSGKQYAKIGGLMLGGAGLALGGIAALPLLAPGTTAGTLIGTTAGGMATGTTSDLISKYFTGNTFGGNVRSTLQHIGVDLSKMSPIGSTLYELGTDMTNPWYYTTSPIEGGFKLANRITDKQTRNIALSNYIRPFGYNGHSSEIADFINGYIFKGNIIPEKTPKWQKWSMKTEPERLLNRQEAFRRYLGVPRASDNLYLLNPDGTFSYNPKRISEENIKRLRDLFMKDGNGNTSMEILTTTLDGPKGTRTGNAGYLTSNIDAEGNFIIDDVWDLLPFKKNLFPKPIRDFEVGKLVGAKPFRVYDTNIGKMGSEILNISIIY